MSTTRYYRFTSDAVINAMHVYAWACRHLAEQAKAMADEFGGIAVYESSVHGRGFAGLRFDPPKDSPLWTKPERNGGLVQRPRSGSAAKVLREQWKLLLPTAKPSTDNLFKACGTHWGELLFAGVAFIMTDDAFYMATGLDLSSAGEEITGGQYEQAGKAVKA